MKQGEIYEEQPEKYQIEDYILSLRFQDEPDWNPEYYKGYNDALTDVLAYINKL